MELKLGFKKDQNVTLDKVTNAVLEKAKEKFGEVHLITVRDRTAEDEPIGFQGSMLMGESEPQNKELMNDKDPKAKVEVPEGQIGCLVIVPSRKVLDFAQNYVLNNKIKNPTVFYNVLMQNIWLAGDPKVFDDENFRAVIPMIDQLTERKVAELKKL